MKCPECGRKNGFGIVMISGVTAHPLFLPVQIIRKSGSVISFPHTQKAVACEGCGLILTATTDQRTRWAAEDIETAILREHNTLKKRRVVGGAIRNLFYREGFLKEIHGLPFNVAVEKTIIQLGCG